MANKAVFGIAKSEAQAITIADNLKAAGFTENDVSVLFPDKQGQGFRPRATHQGSRGRRDWRRRVQSWAEPLARWLGLGHSRFLGLDFLSRRDLSWRPWQARLAARPPED